jgi:hypothetical protein
MQIPAGKATLGALCVAGIAGVVWWRTRRNEDRLTRSQRAYIRELSRQLRRAHAGPESITDTKILRLMKLLDECKREGYPAMEMAERIAAIASTADEIDDEWLLGIEMLLLKLEEKDERHPVQVL